MIQPEFSILDWIGKKTLLESDRIIQYSISFLV